MSQHDHRERIGILHDLWRQLPFLLWLTALWMLLWGQLTVLALVTGLVAAALVTTVFRLPPVELSGRVNPWYGLVFIVTFLGSLVRGSLTVAAQVLDLRRQPGAAVFAVQLLTDDDLLMSHTAIACSLIPGSIVLDADRDRRVLYLHAIGIRGPEDIEAHRRDTLRWEARITRAVGSREQLERLSAPRQEGGA